MSCVYEKDFEKSIRQEKKSKPKNYKRNPLESFVIPGVLNRLFFLVGIDVVIDYSSVVGWSLYFTDYLQSMCIQLIINICAH